MMAIQQLKVGYDNFSYVVYCQSTKKTAIIDPGHNAITVIEFIKNNKLKVEYIINTHYHSDHSGGNETLKNLFQAKVLASKSDGRKLKSKVDKTVEDGDRILLGNVNLEFISTPGHTPGGISIIVDNEALITGDTLFIGDCGRTDLQGGSLTQMYKTLQDKIMSLPDHLIVYPGHDYGDKPFDTLGNQKQTNKTLLAKNLDEFSKIP